LLIEFDLARAEEPGGRVSNQFERWWNRRSRHGVKETGSGASAAIDIAVVLGFLFFASLFQLANFSDRPPYVLLDGDAANIATFAAARDHPDLFGGDEVLEIPGLARWYPTIHVPLVRALARITGDYGTAFQAPVGLHVFLQGVGFYLFGRALFANRYWALLLAIVTLMRVDLNLGELWGIYDYPLPRVTFQALLPFLAAAAYHWRAKPRMWPVIMIAAGLLIYVHPVSTPAWGLAFWLGFLAFLPSRWSPIRSSFVMLGLGGLFLSVTIPFLVHYVSHQDVGASSSSGSYEQVYRIIEARFLPGYMDLPKAFVDFLFSFTTIRWQKFFWIWASVGALLVLAIRRKEPRSVLVVALWMVGLLVTSMLLPFIDHEVARARRAFPLEYDLVRGLRYLVPFMLLFVLWPLAEISRRSTARPSRIGAVGPTLVGAFLVSVWIYWHPPVSLSGLGQCWSQGRVACGPRNDAEFEALEAIRHVTPPGGRILPTDLPLQIRYFSLRPVVHCRKDGGILAYMNHEELLKWHARSQALSSAQATDDPGARLERLVDLGVRFGAQYLFIGFPVADSTARYKVIWMNERYALIELPRPLEEPRS
jgi:hypothetical protein